MADASRREQPADLKTQAEPPDVIDLDRVETTSGFDSLTEATVRFEAPKAREARERREAADQVQKHRVELIKLSLAALLLVGFFALGVYLFAFKSGATEAQKTLGTTILTAIVTGGVGYAFGKKENKSDKE
jgi:uncharacterized protein HemX